MRKTFTVTDGNAEKIKHLAAREHVSESAIMNRALEAYPGDKPITEDVASRLVKEQTEEFRGMVGEVKELITNNR